MNYIKKALMIIAIVAIVAIAGSLLYYFVFFKPEKERAEISLQEQKLELEKERQRATEKEATEKELQELGKKAELERLLGDLTDWYNEAMDKARENYKENWYNECISHGLAPDSLLPMDIANRLDDLYQKDIELLNKEYEDEKDKLFRLYD